MMKKTLLILFALLLVFSFSSFALADMTGKDFVKEAKKTIKEIPVEQAKKDIDAGKAIVLDVRTSKEYKKGHIPKAIHLQRGLLEFKVAKKIPDKNAYIIMYCKSGGRSALSTKTMTRMGYKNVVSMAGGWKAWVKAGYPVN